MCACECLFAFAIVYLCLCFHLTDAPALFAGIKTLRMKISTLKKLNDEDLRRHFLGYGLEAMESMISHIHDAMTNDRSSCSCIYGNPCLQPDNCDNWKDRFRIAHKVRLEKYWSRGRNFDG